MKVSVFLFLLVVVLLPFLNGCRAVGEPLGALRAHPEIRRFTGAEAFHNIRGRDRADCYALHYAQLFANYGENVEFQLTRELIVLDEANRALLYGPEGIPVPRYRRGSRPQLEAFVAGVREGAKTEQEVALAILRRCRDLHKQDPIQDRAWTQWVFGGTEEELIARGERLCEAMGRLFVALCEVEGIPARRVAHIVGGHYAAEAFVDGHWFYCDPRFGIYFLKPDGTGASVAELLDNPALIDQQPEQVKRDVVAYADWETRARKKCQKIYFTPVEMNGFEYYSLADSSRYGYAIYAYPEIEDALNHYNKWYGQLIRKLTTHTAVR